ncbi:YegP family protein, partial [Enterococcus faecalis]|nr:YegP family protein [Enterococcus faecalis]
MFFVIKKASNKKYYFVIKTEENEVIASSKTYYYKSSVLEIIESLISVLDQNALIVDTPFTWESVQSFLFILTILFVYIY